MRQIRTPALELGNLTFWGKLSPLALPCRHVSPLKLRAKPFSKVHAEKANPYRGEAWPRRVRGTRLLFPDFQRRKHSRRRCCIFHHYRNRGILMVGILPI